MRLIDADRLWFERPEFLNPIKEGQEEFNKGWNACIKMFGELIDNQPTVENKYAWHDLRKNPEDLPQKDGLYCVAVKYNAEIQEIGFGQWENMYGYTSGWSALMPNYGEVIAWREIEPFEEVEE